jgi:hypothetical protein
MTLHTFTRPPETYRAESSRVSRRLSYLLPFELLAVLFILALIVPEWTRTVIVREGFGLMEMAQFVMVAASAVLAFSLQFKAAFRRDLLLRVFAVIFAVGAVYWAGEEVSWGQHFFGWLTPEGWSAMNDQQETNLHNIGSWGDQKPRLILMLGIGIGGLIVPFLLLKQPDLLPRRFDILYPPYWLRWVALIVVALESLQHVLVPGLEAETALLRPGELQELYIAWFIFAYALTLRRRASEAV